MKSVKYFSQEDGAAGNSGQWNGITSKAAGGMTSKVIPGRELIIPYSRGIVNRDVSVDESILDAKGIWGEEVDGRGRELSVVLLCVPKYYLPSTQHNGRTDVSARQARDERREELCIK